MVEQAGHAAQRASPVDLAGPCPLHAHTGCGHRAHDRRGGMTAHGECADAVKKLQWLEHKWAMGNVSGKGAGGG
jgi:hypothetical protein